MIQKSIDEPNANLKFLEELKKTRATDELNNIINIGACNVHAVHGAFETEVLSRGWDIKKLLKGAHCILHDIPARREDHFRNTGSTKYLLLFVPVGWIEDKDAAERLRELQSNIVKIFDFWEGLVKSKRLNSRTYLNVLTHIEFRLL